MEWTRWCAAIRWTPTNLPLYRNVYWRILLSAPQSARMHRKPPHFLRGIAMPGKFTVSLATPRPTVLSLHSPSVPPGA